MKILITKCKKCGCIVSGNVVPDFTEPTFDLNYRYELYDVDSNSNKEGFKITGCKCDELKVHPSGLSDYERRLEQIVDAIKNEPSTLICINLLKQF
jgi:hypothetical protein